MTATTGRLSIIWYENECCSNHHAACFVCLGNATADLFVTHNGQTTLVLLVCQLPPLATLSLRHPKRGEKAA